MDEYGKTPEQKFAGMELQNPPMDYYTWDCTIFFLEAPLQGGTAGMHKWEPRARTVVYIGHSPFHAGSVVLVLNTRTRHTHPQKNVAFDDILSTVENMRKVTAPGNWKNMVEENSELATQENITLRKIVTSQ